MGESDGMVSPWLIKASGLGVAVGVGLVVGLVGAGVAVRVGVLNGEVLGVKATVVASARIVGVAVNSLTIGTAVDGGSAGEQPVKMITIRDRARQVLVPNCQ
jgi:hypothetical protein